MNFDEINTELQILANEEVEAKIEEQYEEFLEEMYQIWELDQYAYDCEYGEYYDLR